MRINTNATAVNSHRQYTMNNAKISGNVEKLSSGYRINRAGDDAAGLAISEKMRAQIRGLDMASKNSQDAVSLVQTAEGALQETHNMLQRMRELAVQSASDTNETSVDRNALDKEFQALIKEIDSTAATTRFNDQGIIDGTFAKTTTGAVSQTAGVKAAWASTNIAEGTYTITFGSEEIKAAHSGSVAQLSASSKPDAGDNWETGVTLYKDATTELKAKWTKADDDKTDQNLTSKANGQWTLSFNKDSGEFNLTNAQTGEIKTAVAGNIAKGANSVLDFGSAGKVTLEATGGSVSAINYATMSSKMYTLEKGADKATAEYQHYATFNGKAYKVESGMDTLVFDGLSVTLDTPLSVNTKAAQSDASPINPFDGGSIVVSVTKGNGKDLVVQSGANQRDEVRVNVDRMDSTTLGLTNSKISDRLSASAAITQVNEAVNLVSTQRADLGALQNRLDYKIKNLDTSSENLQAAESRIRDVDMAKESTQFQKNNILAQASTAMLAQANSLPQGVLQLLG